MNSNIGRADGLRGCQLTTPLRTLRFARRGSIADVKTYDKSPGAPPGDVTCRGASMRGDRTLIWVSKVVAVFLLAACTMQDSNPRREALMDTIERLVVLPKGARALDAYGRSYAFADQDRVIGSYSIPINEPGGPCTVVMPDNRSRPCTAKEVAPIDQTPAGVRRWYDTAGDLPRRLWAGCEQVNVVYDISSRRVTEARCDADH